MSTAAPLLQVRKLRIALPRSGDRALAVDGLDFELRDNEIVCLVGESGSGKSMTAHAILGLLPPRVSIDPASEIVCDGTNLARLSEAEMRPFRGSRIGMVFQEPMSALNPLQRVGAQVREALVLHGQAHDEAALRQRVITMLAAVGLPDPGRTYRAYPFELSGGQRQRVMIAMALINEPRVLLADEPTTALDVTTQKQILDLIRQLQAERHMGVLFITHDIGVVADIADRVIVMRHGCAVEAGTRDEVLLRPRHAYTRALIDALPGRRPAARSDAGTRTDALLRIRQLSKRFASGGGLFAPAREVTAARAIDLDIFAGETVAIVGESGSGKSTLGRMVMRLIEPDSGQIEFEGRDILRLAGRELTSFRRHVQMIFQDPFASLNPRMRAGEAIARGPIRHGEAPAAARARARALLERVGLGASAADRFPHEFSGGQRQRISIARAIALEPRLLIADEAVSALDMSIQSQILQLLAELRREFHLTLLFITHDLRVAGEIADRVVVMRRGEVVEVGTPDEVLGAPRHDYTRQLVAAVAGADFLGTLGDDASPLRARA
ncbi:dipeptide ABC transporter ATP-binding protein [Variovorax sp. PBL-E5]|uniref:dipeptide ABC transporter ATP-binding protein n=1 Tax=Variovorax sp. PBL-E5 TaxID=434014 RepID=UPI0013162C62|nr:ABC transporter ATP-binding protein [Variovorax sp. PBL-E5]VTU22309.1 Glutathione import ATP-binding protein GsiA [Variovorax sp. PBL-E5]